MGDRRQSRNQPGFPALAAPLRSLALAAAIGAALATAPGAWTVALAAADRPVTVGMTLEPPHLDPTAGAAAAIKEVTLYNIFETLTRITGTGEVVPGLAEGWEVSEDGLTYRFALRQGVTFHDGTPMSSADVRFSYDRARADDSVNAQKGFFEAIERIETPSEREVVIHMSRPDGLFLFNMGQGDAAIVSPATADDNRTHPVGTGPFRFDRWVEGDRVELMRNEAYWDPELQVVERATFRFVADAAAQVAALLAGDLDAFPNMGAPETLARFEGDSRFAVVVGTTEGETVMGVNHRREPFNDLRVRQALSHAIDRQALIDGAMFGFGAPIGTHFAPHHPAYLDLTELYPYDPDRARDLLAQAGYPDGFSTTFKLPPPPAYARRGGEIIQSQLAQVGIQVELIPVEWAQWLEQAFRGYDYDMTIVAHVEPLDIGIYARGEEYYFGYVNEDFNALIGELDGTSDQELRNDLYARAQRILGEDLASIFLFQLPKIGVRRATLEGFWENSPIAANDLTAVRWTD